jgi:hypothetical protein
MKKIHLFFSILMAAVLCLASTSWAGEASVFDGIQKIIIRAYTAGTGTGAPQYSAYLDIRDSDGVPVPTNKLVVTYLSPTGNQAVQPEEDGTYKIHDNDLISLDFSISFDNADGITYLFCTDNTNGLHVMKFSVVTLLPMDGVCGTTLNACTAGTLNDIADSSTNYLWNCTGANGGTTAYNCSLLKPINGACGTTLNACTTGTLDDIADSSTKYLWNCTGANGGTIANCSANIQSSGTPDIGFPVSYGMVSGVTGSGTSNNVPFNHTITIKNTGNANAGSFTVKTYISTSSIIGASAELVNTWNVSGLAAGQTLAQTFVLTYSGKAVHSYYNMIVKVDADNQITETNEADCKATPNATAGCNTYAYQFFVYR